MATFYRRMFASPDSAPNLIMTSWQSGILIALLCVLFFPLATQAQVTGSVFRDFNGNGTKDANEPLVSGVTVNVYDASNALCATTVTAGTTAPNYSAAGCGTGPVRVEFILPTSGTCVSSGIDYSALSGVTYGTSVQFVNGNSTNVNFALHYNGNYNSGPASTNVFIPCYVNGDPLGGGSSGTLDWFVGFPYTSSGTTPPPQKVNG
ncbi:MAG: SdrD B-like domain-containing protein, partial [Runella sp.]